MPEGLNYVRDMMREMQAVLTEYINLKRAFRSRQEAIAAEYLFITGKNRQAAGRDPQEEKGKPVRKS